MMQMGAFFFFRSEQGTLWGSPGSAGVREGHGLLCVQTLELIILIRIHNSRDVMNKCRV